MKLQILGTEYDFVETNDLISSGSDGECGLYSKIIRVRPSSVMFDNGTDEEKEIRYKEVVRHEIIHAMFRESGLLEYANDETLVDWIATQWNKIAEVMKIAGG